MWLCIRVPQQREYILYVMRDLDVMISPHSSQINDSGSVGGVHVIMIYFASSHASVMLSLLRPSYQPCHVINQAPAYSPTCDIMIFSIDGRASGQTNLLL